MFTGVFSRLHIKCRRPRPTQYNSKSVHSGSERNHYRVFLHFRPFSASASGD